MKDNKLISMVDFVLSKDKADDEISDCYDFHVVIVNYACFLNQPLTLGMFIPCDLEGNVLEEPPSPNNIEEAESMIGQAEEFIEAKERVLFEGYDIGYIGMNGDFSWVNNGIISWVNNDINHINNIKIYSKKFQKETIEDLLKYKLTLTPNALKQIKGS